MWLNANVDYHIDDLGTELLIIRDDGERPKVAAPRKTTREGVAA